MLPTKAELMAKALLLKPPTPEEVVVANEIRKAEAANAPGWEKGVPSGEVRHPSDNPFHPPASILPTLAAMVAATSYSNPTRNEYRVPSDPGSSKKKRRANARRKQQRESRRKNRR